MPVAQPFTTDGVYNGFPSCFPKVDVSVFAKWTTFSGYNKDDSDALTAVTQAQIDQSLQLAGKLFWNLYRVTCDTGNVSIPASILSEVIVSGWDAFSLEPEPDPIEPVGRICEGVITRGGDLQPILADVGLGQGGPFTTAAFARFYDGDTTDEDNYVGIGSGQIDWADGVSRGYDLAPIAMWVIDLVIDPQSFLGGYSNDDIGIGNGYTYEYTYVEREGIHFLWLGAIVDDSVLGPGVVTQVDSETLRAWLENSGDVEDQAQITGLDFYTYP
jgi:hypothetical protein